MDSRGRITIPPQIRRVVGIATGDRVEFVPDGRHVIVKRAEPTANPFEKYQGVLRTFRTKKEINAWLRELRDE